MLDQCRTLSVPVMVYRTEGIQEQEPVSQFRCTRANLPRKIKVRSCWPGDRESRSSFHSQT